MEKAIKSVLQQTFREFELIIIDDGSTDATGDILRVYQEKDHRVLSVRNESNLGIQKSLNLGLRLAKGMYIARIDDDDEWIDVTKLEKQVTFLEERPEHVLVGTGTVVVNEQGEELFRFLAREKDEEIRRYLLGRNCFTHSSVVFRKATALDFGGYSEDKETLHVEDYDLWLKLGTVGKLANLPIYGVKFTLRKGAISLQNKTLQFKNALMLTKKYKGSYPNYRRALCRGYLRLLLYGFFGLLPFAAIKHKILKIYKEG